MRWVAERTPGGELDEIGRWPLSVVVVVDGVGRVLFCHATPRDENELFTVNTPDVTVAGTFAGVDADLLVCGHTHIPFDRMINGMRLVNAGSVGMPFGDTVAQWLTIGPDGVRARRTAYDLSDAAERIARTGYPIPMDPAQPPDAEAMLSSFDRAVASRGDPV